MAPDDPRPDLRRAYRAAWVDRVETADTSDEALLRQMRREGVHDVGGGASEWLLELWRRQVPRTG